MENHIFDAYRDQRSLKNNSRGYFRVSRQRRKQSSQNLLERMVSQKIKRTNHGNTNRKSELL